MVDSRRRSTALGRYWRTVRHLRPVQVHDRFVRHLPRLDAHPGGAVPRPAHGRWIGAGPRDTVFTGPDQVRLLHREARLGNWDPPELPRLWRYHLHYFDDIESPHFAAIARRWIVENPSGSGPGWEPYPLSRRIPNWIAWILRGNEPCAGMLASLADQAGAMERQLEYHLLGNHLLANLRALIFAGCFFPNRASWFARGCLEFSRELDDQLLPGGAHAERSPMYHALILTDLLDLVALDRVYPGVIATRHVDHWRQSAGAMLAWLRRMLHPDGTIAFFQDAAFDMAPSPGMIFEYAQRLGVDPAASGRDHSGYARLELPGTVLLADVAGPGPAHQPGHAHAGALSFELSHRGHRFLVNSGTSTYEPGPERNYERSTEAHNTLRLDGRDQSEMWAAFRVGRRAAVVEHGRTAIEIDASHNGYAPVLHRRRWQLEATEVRIEDEVHGPGKHGIEILFHFHPGIAIVRDGHCFTCRHPNGAAIRLHAPAGTNATIETSNWRPEFGWRVPNLTLRIQARVTLPAHFRTRVELLS